MPFRPMRLLCALGSHDYVPLYRPEQETFSEHARCRCSRCGEIARPQTFMSSHLTKRWEKAGRPNE